MGRLKSAYPGFYAHQTPDAIEAAIQTWADEFIDYDYRLVLAAVRTTIATDRGKDSPTIGQIKNWCYRLTHPHPTEREAWNTVLQALDDIRHHECEPRHEEYKAQRFKQLPPAIRLAVGSETQLLDMEDMPKDKLHTIMASNFMRAYREIVEHDREVVLMPREARQIMAAHQQELLTAGGDDR